jgi:hypothetical protein
MLALEAHLDGSAVSHSLFPTEITIPATKIRNTREQSQKYITSLKSDKLRLTSLCTKR